MASPAPEHDALREPLRRALGRRGLGAIELLIPPKAVEDDPAKLLVRDAGGRRAAVLALSPPVAPDLVARAQRGARAAREALGPELGAPVLLPIAEGEHQGRSWALLPWREPIPERQPLRALLRRRVGPALLHWLRGVAAATRAQPAPEELESGFAAPLRALEAFPGLAEGPRAAAALALERLATGAWRPRFVLAHNDLWSGNVLLRGGPLAALSAPSRFAVIDWPASQVRGHALFDLLRAGRSFGVGRRRLARELAHHCRLLECGSEDASCHLAAAVGSVAVVLDRMPRELFREMAETTFATLAGVLGPAGRARPTRAAGPAARR